LGFQPLRAERYDFAVRADRWDQPAVVAFQNLLAEDATRLRLVELGFDPRPDLEES
jgi:putative molybdopterin biosynthesis protein